MNSYKELIVWQKSIELITKIYLCTTKFPSEEKFNLTSQSRRAATSIATNLAEGYSRKTTGEFLHFTKIAFGSAAEMETLLYIALNLKFIDKTMYDELGNDLTEVLKMLNSLIAKLKGKLENKTKN